MSKNYILRVCCKDKPGIVAAVARALEENACNIEDAAQFNDKLSGRFFMRVALSPLKENAIQNFTENFAQTAQTYQMDWSIHPENKKIKTILMVSKTDHCLNDLLYRSRTNHLPIEITAVISNHEDLREIVEQQDLRFEYLPVSSDTKKEQEQKITQIAQETETELIVLARYMQIMSLEMCNKFHGRMINIHHSFLPGFKGAKPYHQAYERGVKIIGATAHFATQDLDEGPIIKQETVHITHAVTPKKMQILGRDTEARVLASALTSYTERRIFLHGNRTVIL